MKKNTQNWIIIIVTCLLVILQQCDKAAISVAAIPISKDLGFNKTEIGLIISIFFIGYTALNFIGGFFTDKFGAKKVVTVVAILWSIATGVTGLAWSFESMLIIRFIFGACEGPFPSTNSKTVAELFPAEKRAFAKSFITATSALGTGFAAIAVTQITHTLGWRDAFKCYAIIGFVLVVTFILVSRNWKRPVNADGTVIKSVRVPYKALFKAPLLWKLLVMNFASGVFAWGLNSWMPSYWMNVRKLSLTTMGFVTFIPSFFSFFVVLSLGWGLDRGLAGREKYVIGGGAAISALFVFLTFMAPSVTMGVVCQSVASIGSACVTGTIMICIVKYFAANAIGSASGLVNGACQGAGIIAPTLMGIVLDTTHSYAAVFGMVVFVEVVAALIALTVDTKSLAGHPIAGDYIAE